MRFRRCAGAAAVDLLAVLAASVGTAGAAPCPWMNPALTPNARAEMLLGAMSLSDKVAMTYQRYPLDDHYGAAGYIPGNASLCIPDLVFNDAGQGVGDAQTSTSAFPPPIAQSASWDPGLQYQFGAALGQEAWEKGIDEWAVTPGNYTVYVGDSSASLPLEGTLSHSAAQLPAGAY